MPFVHIRSLPPTRPQFDAAAAAERVRAELAAAAGIEEEHVTVTWEFAVAQASARPLVLVDVLAPDFHPPERVEAMIRSVAASAAREAGVEAFVSFRAARSGHVFDEGDIVRW